MEKSWIFDFDGTLINSEFHLRETFTKITKKISPSRLDAAKTVLIGPPLKVTAKNILGESTDELLNLFTSAFIKCHDEELLKNIKIYPDVHKTLSEFYKMGYKMAIATNKREAPTKKIIEHLGWQKFFINVECIDSEPKERNKSKMIKIIIERNNCFEKAFFVGDTTNDGNSSSANKIRFIKAEYGYGSTEDWKDVKIYKKIDSFKELMHI